MAFEITRPGKYSLTVETPVMPAAGSFGFGDAYRNLIDLKKLGAIVTNPVTLNAWSPARGTRVVSLDAGTLIHTGLPNPGLAKVIKRYRKVWHKLTSPMILHLVATNPNDIRRAVEMIDQEESIDAIELGLSDDLPVQNVQQQVTAAVENLEKPVVVRLPMYNAGEVARVVADAGADALVVAGAPRGTARDPLSGQLVSGRIYGPLIKPLILRLVGVLADDIPDVPIIGAGGIHSSDDARDYLEAGAVAVQVDTAIWVQPSILERIAYDLGGWMVTKKQESLPDEWHPGMRDIERSAMNIAPSSVTRVDDST